MLCVNDMDGAELAVLTLFPNFIQFMFTVLSSNVTCFFCLQFFVKLDYCTANSIHNTAVHALVLYDNAQPFVIFLTFVFVNKQCQTHENCTDSFRNCVQCVVLV